MYKTVLLLFIFVMLCAAQQQDTLHLTLKEAERLALANNPAISSAKSTAGAAGQVVNEVHSNLEPTVTGLFTGVGADSGSRLAAGGLNNPVVYNRLGSGLQINQLITDFGRTNNLVASAKFRASAQDQVTETVKANVLLATDRAYFDLLRAQAILTVAQQTVTARQLVSDQITQLAAAQLKSQLDVSFANVNLADAKLQLAAAQNAQKAAIAQLATAMGIPGQQYLAIADEPMPDAPPDRVDDLLQTAIHNRPELQRLRLESIAAERFMNAEKALRYPSIGLFGTAGFVPAGEAVLPGQYGAVGATVSIPILNGGLFKARQSEAQFRAQAVNHDIRDEENRVIRDVRVAYLNAANAWERVGLTAQLLDQARLSQDLAQKRYDLGLSSIVELSQAQLNYTNAQIANTSAKYDYQAEHSLLLYEVGDLK